ncbi:MAG: response regulator [Planctomycetes bacterium]|nr:response regulator [Planctomycetota bacterium]
MSTAEKVMVVDDEMVMRDLLYTVLTRQNYKVITAPNGREALDMMAKESPDLVILDLMMPGMNGLETFVQMRRIDPKIETILLTGTNIDDLETQARKLGISEILRKGVGVELFLKSVNYVLDKRKSKQSGPEVKSKGDILVVDDDSEIRFMLEKFFTRQGYQVSTASSGEEALDRLSKYSAVTAKKSESKSLPLIVLLDIKLGGMDGLMALKKIKELDKKISVLMISGINDESITREAMRLGAYDYIMKPFNMEYLDMVVMTKILLAE